MDKEFVQKVNVVHKADLKGKNNTFIRDLDIFEALCNPVKFYRTSYREHHHLFPRSPSLLPYVMCLAQASYLRCHEHRGLVDNLNYRADFFGGEEELVPDNSTIALLLQVI